MKKSAMALLTLLAGLVMGGGVVTTAQANSKKDTYYRAYYNGKNIGWIHAASLK